MPAYEIALNAFFIAPVLAVTVGGLLSGVMTQHPVAGYEDCRVRRRPRISLGLVPVDPARSRPPETVRAGLARSLAHHVTSEQ